MDIVRLNVGGKRYDVARDTLEKYPQSFLAKIVSKNFSHTLDQDGRIFLDRSGKKFEWILDFLRDGVMEQSKEAKREFEYYCLPWIETPPRVVMSGDTIIYRAEDYDSE